jgi:hypothetical protein
MEIPSFIEELLQEGVRVLFERDSNGGVQFVLDGFYKSGEATVCLLDGAWVAKTRYKQIDPVESVEDLVRINHEWWKYSQNRNTFWEQPDGSWIGLLEKYGFYVIPAVPERMVCK